MKKNGKKKDLNKFIFPVVYTKAGYLIDYKKNICIICVLQSISFLYQPVE